MYKTKCTTLLLQLLCINAMDNFQGLNSKFYCFLITVLDCTVYSSNTIYEAKIKTNKIYKKKKE